MSESPSPKVQVRKSKPETETPGPPGWGLGAGLAPLHYKKPKEATETSRRETNQTQILGDVDAPGGSSMKPGDESRKEVTERTSLLSSKIAKIGTWNVRTMFETGKVFQVARERQAYNIDILGLAETRWNQTGKKRLSTGELLVYSGHPDENARHEEGVALMLSKKAEKALIAWEGHGSRIITASFTTKSRNINVNVIQCYAPTKLNDKKEET